MVVGFNSLRILDNLDPNGDFIGFNWRNFKQCNESRPFVLFAA
jgi:hypothetical protein